MENKQKKIIDSYVSGSHSPEVEGLFNCWLSSPVDAEAKDAALNGLWERVPAESAATESALKRLHERLFGTRREHFVPRRVFLRWVAAAVILPIVAAAASFVCVKMFGSEPVEWTQLAVPYGERRQVTLADGTQLWVGAGTRVVYPRTFEGRERKIFVDGEIYAEVAHDEEHPFIVSTSDADVRVLGTTFGLRAYDSDEEAELMLVEGRVNFEIAGKSYNGTVELLPSDMVRYNRDSGVVEKSRFNAAGFHSWARDGSIYFFNEPLGNIASMLSRRFDRQIVITDPSLAKLEFYIFLSSTETLNDVLNVLKMNESIHIRSNNGIIYIQKRIRN